MPKLITINEFSLNNLTSILKYVSRELIKYIPKDRWCRSANCIGCVQPNEIDQKLTNELKSL